MDVNSIQESLGSLSASANKQLNKSNNASKITEDKSNFLKLSINGYNIERDELSQSLKSLNEGIGISKTAQTGLENQAGYLENIQTKLTEISSDENQTSFDNNSIKNELNSQLTKFKNEAYGTTYQKEQLLVVNSRDDNNTINVSTRDSYFSIDKPNTPQIASNVAQSIRKNDLNDSNGLQETISSVNQGISELNSAKTQFSNFEEDLKTSAKNSIEEQVELSNQSLKEVDFNKEIEGFSKENIQSNRGYLAASQANIVQEQSVRLLS